MGKEANNSMGTGFKLNYIKGVTWTEIITRFPTASSSAARAIVLNVDALNTNTPVPLPVLLISSLPLLSAYTHTCTFT